MKKTIILLSAIFMTSLSVNAYDLDANSLFRANLKTRLAPNTDYVLNCPSIIEKIDVEEKSNVKFYYLDNKPYKNNEKRGANRVLVHTLEPTSSSFSIFMQDGKVETLDYKIDAKNKKQGAIAGVCRIEP